MSTRSERKAIQRAHFAELDRISKLSAAQRAEADRTAAERRAKFEREHPILSGAVPLVDYVPPRGSYIRRPA